MVQGIVDWVPMAPKSAKRLEDGNKKRRAETCLGDRGCDGMDLKRGSLVSPLFELET